MPTPIIEIPLLGLSDESLDQLINLLDREATTLGNLPQWQPSVRKANGHLEHQLFTCIREQEMRKRATDTLATNMIKIGLAGLGITRDNPQPVPID